MGVQIMFVITYFVKNKAVFNAKKLKKNRYNRKFVIPHKKMNRCCTPQGRNFVLYL